MTLADATAILYGPVPKYDVVIHDHGNTDRDVTRCFMNARDLETLLTTETRPCSIYVDGLLIKRVKP